MLISLHLIKDIGSVEILIQGDIYCKEEKICYMIPSGSVLLSKAPGRHACQDALFWGLGIKHL